MFNDAIVSNISQNNIEKLPMEIGLINKLESLSLEKNEFTEIPSTLCYLNNLKQINLEWFEFLDPELPKEQKDKNIIHHRLCLLYILPHVFLSQNVCYLFYFVRISLE